MYTDEKIYIKALNDLTEIYGETERISSEYSFSDFSIFYEKEMHSKVLKRLVSFKILVDPSRISEIKLKTNEIEKSYTSQYGRNVNLDPCLLSHGKFVMATTKGASFRVPHEKGIYTDLSLVYARKHWVDFFWTYFDIKSEFVKDYLIEVRNDYLKQRTGYM